MAEWPGSIPNPTWHDHVYADHHSPKDDEEHHKAVDVLCERVAHLEAALRNIASGYALTRTFDAADGSKGLQVISAEEYASLALDGESASDA